MYFKCLDLDDLLLLASHETNEHIQTDVENFVERHVACVATIKDMKTLDSPDDLTDDEIISTKSKSSNNSATDSDTSGKVAQKCSVIVCYRYCFLESCMKYFPRDHRFSAINNFD